MDQIKKVFSPGSTKDDEVMYGNPQERLANSASNQAQHDTSQLHPVEGAEKKESGGVLRQIVNPGGNKHDEQAYGTTATTAEPERRNNKLNTSDDHKDSGVSRQILNPGGKKYDETAHGTTAATEGDRSQAEAIDSRTTTVSDPNTNLETKEGKEHKGILKRIFHPDRSKRDETTHASTAQEVSRGDKQTATGESNIGRDAAIGGGAAAVGGGAAYGATRGRDETQHGPLTSTNTTTTTTTTSTSTLPSKPTDSYNPGRDANTAQSGTFGTAPTASATDGLSSQATKSYNAGRDIQDQSSLPIHDRFSTGGVGSSAGTASGPTHGASQSEGEHSSNFGRNAAIAGGGAAVLGAGGYAAHEHGKRNNDPTLAARGQTDGLADGRTSNQAAHQQSGAHGAGRDAGMSSTSGIPPTTAQKLEAGSDVPGSSTSSGVPASGAIGSGAGTSSDSGYIDQLGSSNRPHGHINPVGAPSSHAGRDVGIVGGSAAAGAATAQGVPNSDPDITQLNRAPSDVQSATYLDRSYYMGTSPHMPGEFPSSSGEDIHRSGTSSAPSPDIATAGAATAMRSHDPIVPSTTTTSQPGIVSSGTDHTGRNAAIGGGALGAGALGAGAAYRATRDRDTSTTQPTSLQQAVENSSQPSQVAPSAASATVPATGGQAPATYQQSTQPQTQEHHYGRDAAIAGGAGAVGAGGMYAATRDHDAPRMQPADLQQAAGNPGQPVQVAPSATSANAPATGTQAPATYRQADQPQTQEHHYGRNTAIAGGAGAVGAGGVYAANRDREEPGTISHFSQTQGGSTLPQTSAPATYNQTSRPGEQFQPHTTSDPSRSGVAQHSVPAAASTTKQQDEHHYGRDAALAGGAGAVGAGGIYAATRDRGQAADTTHDAYGAEDPNKQNRLHKQSPDEKKLEKEHAKEEKKLEKEHAKEEKKLEKEHHKEEKERQHAAEKAQHKADKEHQKEVEKAEKKHDKEVAAAAKKHDKEEEKAEQKRQKELEKQRKEEEKAAKPSLIDRILHRHPEDKDNDNKDKTVDDDSTKRYLQPESGRPSAVAGAAGNHSHPAIEHTSNSLNHPLIAPVDHSSGSNTVTAPHSGLPMDLNKGTGQGGTDGSGTIPGYSGSATGAQAGQGVAGPDYEAVKKANNTPY